MSGYDRWLDRQAEEYNRSVLMTDAEEDERDQAPRVCCECRQAVADTEPLIVGMCPTCYSDD